MSFSMELRRTLCAGVAIGLFVVLVWLPSAASAAEYGGGNGTREDPFLIRTAEQFAMIGENPAHWDQHFKLMTDIDLSDYDEKNLRLIGHWVVLGSPENRPFRGSFDGDGRTISGLRYRDLDSDYVGLFQYAAGDIRNLRLAQATVVGNGMGTGALVGYMESGAISDCFVTQADVSGNMGVGALVGSLDGGVFSSGSDGRVAGVRYVGGLVGQVRRGTVAESCSKARVVGQESVGGLIGATLAQIALVDSCYATGPVEGTLYVAGLVGQVSAGTVAHCYSTGRVSGNQFTGGLVGYQRALAEVLNSLWDTEASQQATSVGGSGRTTVEMKAMDTYLAMGWDFFHTWTICEPVSYPIMMWQIPVGDLRCPDGVNFTDFAWLAKNWLRRDCLELNYFCDWADIDQSGEVDYQDLALFADNWLAGTDWHSTD